MENYRDGTAETVRGPFLFSLNKAQSELARHCRLGERTPEKDESRT